MNAFSIFHTTISSKELRPAMPAVPLLLSAASFLRQNSKGHARLHEPRSLPDHPCRGADCGGFPVATRWGGQYRYTPPQYIRWLASWQPQCAATFDLPCLYDDAGTPLAEAIVEERQRWTTMIAWEF